MFLKVVKMAFLDESVETTGIKTFKIDSFHEIFFTRFHLSFLIKM